MHTCVCMFKGRESIISENKLKGPGFIVRRRLHVRTRTISEHIRKVYAD
jgi:hypothetical protein